MEGVEVVRLETVIKDIDIFITATGNNGIITAEHMSHMKNNAIVGNIGNFDTYPYIIYLIREIDTNGLKNYPNIEV